MPSKMLNSPVARIDLASIRSNLALVRSLAPKSRVLAVVKANAYGHGAAEVAAALPDADALCVARVEEGMALRAAEITRPIVVLEGFIDRDELEACRIERLTPALHSRFQVDMLKQSPHADLPVWIKLDTGMHRLGFSIEEFRAGMTSGDALNVAAVMSHFANADDPDNAENRDQIEIFLEMTHDLDVELSIANSGGIINYPNSHLDWVRPGVMLYGGSPAGVPDVRLRPAMTLTAPVVSVNHIMQGESIGYGSAWVASEDTRVAIIGIGYADGYPREMPEGAPVILHGKRRGIVGRISMDMTFVQLEPGDDVVPGDMATLWGDGLPVDEVASLYGTISYTLMSGLTNRVRRVYEND